MSIKYERRKISDGIHFSTAVDERFKTTSVSVNLMTPLTEETASANAIIPFILAKSSSDYPTLTAINMKLSSLYGAWISGSVGKLGDTQLMSLRSSAIADKYTLEGEKISSELIDMLISCLMSPYIEDGRFYDKDFQLKKQELLDDIDAEINDKRGYAFIRAGKLIYEGEPSAITAHGDRAHAEALTSEAVYVRYKELLKTAQIEVVFAGSGDFTEAYDKMKNAMLGMERAYAGANTSGFSPVKDTPAEMTDTLEIAQSKMVMAFKSGFKNYPATVMFLAIFGATPFSKLFVNVREKLSLCYYCSAGYNNKKGVLTVDSGVETENIEKARAEILNQLDAMIKGDFTDEEMENARLSVINSLRSKNDSLYSITDWYLSKAYMNETGSPEDEIESILAVTRDEITEAAGSFRLDTVYRLIGKGGEEE